MPRDMQRYLRDGLGVTTFCAGCGHGILMGAILRAVDGLGLDPDRLLFVSGIGCAAWIPSPHFRADTLHTLHGRAVAYAVGAKVANPSLEVIVVSGDGDLSSIGGNHLIHAMTGGQSASTTPLGALTATSLEGNPYPPFDLSALVRAAGATYAACWPVSRPWKLVEAIGKAITCRGMGFVEAISPCPTQYGRRNRHESVPALYDHVESLCVTGDEAARMSADERARHFVVGEWTRG
jgi:2-oxoglutarate ferredoxin oxidoreductase subunit beta